MISSSSLSLYADTLSSSRGRSLKTEWMVEAAKPELSVILLAALPVGARKSCLSLPLMARSTSAITFMVVVFPVPGPPVMIDIFDEKALRTAPFWDASSSIPLSCFERYPRAFLLSSFP